MCWITNSREHSTKTSTKKGGGQPNWTRDVFKERKTRGGGVKNCLKKKKTSFVNAPSNKPKEHCFPHYVDM